MSNVILTLGLMETDLLCYNSCVGFICQPQKLPLGENKTPWFNSIPEIQKKIEDCKAKQNMTYKAHFVLVPVFLRSF